METTMTEQAVVRQAVPLPATRDDMLARKTMKIATLNDHVDLIHQALWDNTEKLNGRTYQEYLRACWDAQAYEGSLTADHFMASTMIRNYARKNGPEIVENERLAAIGHSLNVVLRRYHISRKERRIMVGDEAVTTTDNDN